jgi:protein-S-isoprenylcysteine O-methyltransferase Ste14
MRARIALVQVVAIAAFGVILFGSAGRVDLPWVWGYLALWLVYLVAAIEVALRLNPDLVRERMKPPSDREPLTRRLAVVPGIGHLVVAGLDVGRFGWSSIGPAIHTAGFVALAAGMALIGWTFAANRFASSAVRIQDERGQTVVSTGPYALVRHPMYLGVLLMTLGSGPALGSWWALLVVSPIVPIFVRRTRIEDRMLHEELPGYAEYARSTRWRIVPGVF